jgi:prepilin-type N-terminal cleavage/methylation domain-containing protein
MKLWFRGRSTRPQDEHGFTLPEVLTTIAILGILIAIAMTLWNSVIESRRVDSAANQLASDLRLAHTKATNQLTDWRVIYEVGEREYHLVKLNEVCDEGCTDPEADKVIRRELPSGTEVTESLNAVDPAGQSRFNIPNVDSSVNQPGTTHTVEFDSDGSSKAGLQMSASLKVGSRSEPSTCWKLIVSSATSNVRMGKEDGCA